MSGLCIANVNSVERTKKQDWFTNYLYSTGFWVGGTRVNISSYPNLLVRQTFRYFRASTKDFLVIYILEFSDKYDESIDYEVVVKSLQSEIELPTNFTLIIWPHGTPSFGVYKDGNFQDKLNDEQALSYFKAFDNNIIGKSKNLKPLNRSFTDFFHMWARQNMKGFQNDIDSFLSKDNVIYMLELKRPRESVSTWKPYKADTNNYIQFSQYTQDMNFKLINIAYSLDEPGKLKVFKDVQVSQSGDLTYKTNVILMKPEDELLSLIRSTQLFPETSNR